MFPANAEKLTPDIMVKSIDTDNKIDKNFFIKFPP
jgi:hypothetical protein